MADRFAPAAQVLGAAVPDVLLGLDREQFAERRGDRGPGVP
jgi:hypothetical protein